MLSFLFSLASTYLILTSDLSILSSEAFKNVVRRLLEASGRGMWDADEETIDKLKSLYSDADDLVSCLIPIDTK